MLDTLIGMDHVVVTVHDLDRAADNWRALGFQLSPRGTHSEHVGTGNYTMMLAHDYLELVGVLHDTPLNAPSRQFLQRRGEGIERIAFRTRDAVAGAAALRARGIEPVGPVSFSRPVSRPDGSATIASFSVFHWPFDRRPADTRLFACEHHTPDAVWLPALQQHPNTATRIMRVELISPRPNEAAAELAALIHLTDTPSPDQPDGHAGFRLPTAPFRGSIDMLSPDAFLARHPQAAHGSLPREGVAALVIGVDDIEAAIGCTGATPEPGRKQAWIPADRANGVLLQFTRNP